MTEPIARAAKAIGDTLNKGTTKDILERAATAALATMEEPSPAMILAGAKTCNFPLATWRAMHATMMKE